MTEVIFYYNNLHNIAYIINISNIKYIHTHTHYTSIYDSIYTKKFNKLNSNELRKKKGCLKIKKYHLSIREQVITARRR